MSSHVELLSEAMNTGVRYQVMNFQETGINCWERLMMTSRGGPQVYTHAILHPHHLLHACIH